MKISYLNINYNYVSNYLDFGDINVFKNIETLNFVCPSMDESNAKNRLFLFDDGSSVLDFKIINENYTKIFQINVITQDNILYKFFIDIYSFYHSKLLENEPFYNPRCKNNIESLFKKINNYINNTSYISYISYNKLINLYFDDAVVIYKLIKILSFVINKCLMDKKIYCVVNSDTHGDFIHLLTSLIIGRKINIDLIDEHNLSIVKNNDVEMIDYVFNGDLIEHSYNTYQKYVINNVLATVSLANKVFLEPKIYFIEGNFDSIFINNKVFKFEIYNSLKIKYRNIIPLYFSHDIQKIKLNEFVGFKIISKSNDRIVEGSERLYTEFIPKSYTIENEIMYAIQTELEFHEQPIYKLIYSMYWNKDMFYFVGHDGNYEKINVFINNLLTNILDNIFKKLNIKINDDNFKIILDIICWTIASNSINLSLLHKYKELSFVEYGLREENLSKISERAQEIKKQKRDSINDEIEWLEKQINNDDIKTYKDKAINLINLVSPGNGQIIFKELFGLISNFYEGNKVSYVENKDYYLTCTDTFGPRINIIENCLYDVRLPFYNLDYIYETFNKHSYLIFEIITDKKIKIDRISREFRKILKKFINDNKLEILKLLKPRFLFQFMERLPTDTILSSLSIDNANAKHAVLWRNAISKNSDKDLCSDVISGCCFASQYYPTTSFSRYGHNFIVTDTKTKNEVVLAPHDMGYVKELKNVIFNEYDTLETKKQIKDYINSDDTQNSSKILDIQEIQKEKPKEIFLTTYSNIEDDLFSLLYDNNKYTFETYRYLIKTLNNINLSVHEKIYHLLNAISIRINKFTRFFTETENYFEYRLNDITYDNVFDIHTTYGKKGTHTMNLLLMSYDIRKYYTLICESLELILDNKLQHDKNNYNIVLDGMIRNLFYVNYKNYDIEYKDIFRCIDSINDLIIDPKNLDNKNISKIKQLYNIIKSDNLFKLSISDELYNMIIRDTIFTHDKKIIDRGNRLINKSVISLNEDYININGKNIKSSDYLTILKYKNNRDYKNYKDFNSLSKDEVNKDIEKHFINSDISKVNDEDLYEAYDEKYFIGGLNREKIIKYIMIALITIIIISVIVSIICLKHKSDSESDFKSKPTA